MSKWKQLYVVLIVILSLSYNIKNITFGLPVSIQYSKSESVFWYNDEPNEVEHIKSLLRAEAKMLHFTYPPLQYLLVSMVFYPTKFLHNFFLEDWMLVLASRVISATAVAIGCALIFLIGERLYPCCGLFASLLFAVAPLAAMLAKDVKPIALSGLFILAAVYTGIIAFDRAFEKKKFVIIGTFLGLSLTTSHLSFAYSLLPVILVVFYFIMNKNNYPSPKKHIANTKAQAFIMYSLLSGLFFCGIVLTAFLFYKSDVLAIAKEIYNNQQHAKPFESHLTLIMAFYDQIIKGLTFLLISLFIAILYLYFKKKTRKYALIENLAFLEVGYASMVSCIMVVIGVATLLNPLIPISYLNFIRDTTHFMSIKSGYYGMYPGDFKAPSYVTQILPYCIGVPLYFTAIAGILCLLSKRVATSKFILLGAFVPFMIQLLTWNQTFRASRFAYTFVYFMVLMAGLTISLLITENKYRFTRIAGGCVFLIVFLYTLMYSYTYVESRNAMVDGRTKAAHWVENNVPHSKTVGVRANTDIPRNQAPIESLPHVTLSIFEKYPDFCVMDGFEYFVMKQYFEISSKDRYNYTPSDWWPSQSPPQGKEIKMYDRIVNEKSYRLVAHLTPDSFRFWKLKFDFKLLNDPAENFHREQYIFEKIDQSIGRMVPRP